MQRHGNRKMSMDEEVGRIDRHVLEIDSSDSHEKIPPVKSQADMSTTTTTTLGAEEETGKEGSEGTYVVEATWRELIRHWFILGWTAFGGPAAHIGMFQKLFVDRLKWCTYLVFTELLMLGQCMPGPTSTQMGFALGVLKKGLSGGLVSGALFQGPGLLILSILGWAASRVLDRNIEWLNGLVAGLAAAGIALVASAAFALTRNICKTRLLQILATIAAVIAFYYPRPWTFPALIVAGGLVTMVFNKKEPVKMEEMAAGVDRLGFGKIGGGILIAAWIAVLIGVLVAAGETNYSSNEELHWFAAFYRTGSVIFGGGQVVLPMLYNDVVAADCADQSVRCCPVDGSTTDSDIIEYCKSKEGQYDSNCKCSWMSGNEFYAGLALAQAMPGPLFNFAAYLGAVIAQNGGVFPILGIIICWVGLFAPGIMLIFAILPYWGAFRKWKLYRHALPGLNSAAVGLIISSVFQLSLNAYVSSPFPTTSICIGILAFAATDVVTIPAPFVVVGGGVIGVIGWAANMI